MATVALYNIKGGVGKTATAVNLAYLAARAGAQTILFDLILRDRPRFIFASVPPGNSRVESSSAGAEE